MKLRRLPLFSLILVFCLSWGYLSTLLPGIGYSGDAIKFQYVGKVLGIPHAPGYPLYLLLNHLFVSLFPFGSTAYKANLLSAIYAVGACFMLFKLLEQLGLGRFLALVAALIFGFSRAFWSQAVVAEVYTLHMLLMVSVMYFLIKWHLQRRDHDFYLATALYALSFGNHLLAITLLPAFAYLVAVTNPKVFVHPKKVLWVVSVVALGALQYSYLFWRLNDPQTPYIEGFNGHNFFHFVTGGPFKPLMFAFTLGEVVEQRIPLFLTFMRDNMPVLSLGAVAGVFVGRMPGPVRTFLLIYFFSNALYAVNYNIPDIDGYFLANDLVVAVFLGVALAHIARWVQQPNTWTLGFLLLLPVALYVTNYRAVDKSGTARLQQQTEAVLEAVGQDALIITSAYTFQQAFLYYLIGEGWEQARNLHTTRLEGVLNGLQAYLEEDKPLPVFSRTAPKVAVPLGMPIYVYPCSKDQFSREDFMVTWPEQHLPQLCRIEAPL